MINTGAVCDALIRDIGNQLKIDLVDFVLISTTGYKQILNYRLKMLCLSEEKELVINYLKEAYKLTEEPSTIDDSLQSEWILENSKLEEIITLLRLKGYL
jgi:hypothetical protein